MVVQIGAARAPSAHRNSSSLAPKLAHRCYLRELLGKFAVANIFTTGFSDGQGEIVNPGYKRSAAAVRKKETMAEYDARVREWRRMVAAAAAEAEAARAVSENEGLKGGGEEGEQGDEGDGEGASSFFVTETATVLSSIEEVRRSVFFVHRNPGRTSAASSDSSSLSSPYLFSTRAPRTQTDENGSLATTRDAGEDGSVSLDDGDGASMASVATPPHTPSRPGSRSRRARASAGMDEREQEDEALSDMVMVQTFKQGGHGSETLALFQALPKDAPKCFLQPRADASLAVRSHVRKMNRAVGSEAGLANARAAERSAPFGKRGRGETERLREMASRPWELEVPSGVWPSWLEAISERV